MADLEKITEKNREIAKKSNELNRLKGDRFLRQESDFNFILTNEYNELKAVENQIQNQILALKLAKTLLFHEYRFNIRGNYINTDGTTDLITRTQAILSTIDCKLGHNPTTLNMTIPTHIGLFREITNEWMSYYNGQITLVTIVQVR